MWTWAASSWGCPGSAARCFIPTISRLFLERVPLWGSCPGVCWPGGDPLLLLFPQLDIMEPKVPDDIYKTHLENNRKGLGLLSLPVAGDSCAAEGWQGFSRCRAHPDIAPQGSEGVVPKWTQPG